MSRGKEKEYAEVDAECIRETELALLVAVDDGAKEVWVPKALVSEDSEVQATGDSGSLVIEEWFALREGLE